MTISDNDRAILLPEAIMHYDQIDEANQLTGTRGQLELLRTQELLSRYLPDAPARILGGGAGIHSFWLADRGYDVHLIDAVPLHVELAEQTAKERDRKPLTMQVGDARQLQFEDHTMDAALLFGPLYHLTSRGDRLKCLQEARRVLRPSGLVMNAPRNSLTMECPAFYYDALVKIATSLDLWETEYSHVMESAASIVDWMSSTGLRPFLAALETDTERNEFTSELHQRVRDAYQVRADVLAFRSRVDRRSRWSTYFDGVRPTNTHGGASVAALPRRRRVAGKTCA